MTRSAQSKYRTKYRILGLVGSGQFGRVFCARDRQTNQLVALKELEPRRFPTHKFLRELRFLISLSHINIVSCISVDYNQNRRYLVMEYCEAGTLRNLMESNLIESNLEQQSQNLYIYLNLIIEILSGLKYTHSLNIIHCDLKPENILLKLTATGWQPKISDFGISRLAQESGKYDNTGSPAYMAPERFYGQFSVGSDLYAVGIILYELMVKERPFLGNPTELMFAHINQRLRVPNYIPNALKNFLHKALEKLPARRFSSAQDMQAELYLLMATDLSSELLNTNQIESTQYINKPEKSDAFISEKQLLETIVAFNFSDSLNFYTATEYLLKKSNLGSILNHQTSHKFNDKITDLVITRNQAYIITNHSIYRISNNFQNQQILYVSNQKFHWAIADQWLAIFEQNSSKLQIQYFSDVYKPMIIDFPKASVVALLKITNHHLALISNTDQGSNIYEISRRGCLMANFDLDMTISMAIASFEGGRILLATNLDYLVLVDWKPYRVMRVNIGYKPQLIKATKWGYIATRDFTKEGESTTLLNFMDTQCNYVGGSVVTGLVKAIACFNDHILIISVETPIPSSDASIAKILILDLKQLDLDLVF